MMKGLNRFLQIKKYGKGFEAGMLLSRDKKMSVI